MFGEGEDRGSRILSMLIKQDVSHLYQQQKFNSE